MKKYLLFALCSLLFASVLHADDFDAARAAKRTSANTIATTAVRIPESRGAGNAGGAQRSATNDVRENAVGVSRTAASQTVAPRTATSVQSRAAFPTLQRVSMRGTTSPTISARSAARTAPASARAATPSARSATVARAAATTTTPASTTDYKKCREVYYSCMDEFCANKDTSLKRCACSARMNEFDGVKAQLAKIEDQMLDFNERLLTVNMDKEDVAAISQATVGELAYQTEDKSDSKKMLDEISKKLKENTSDTDMSKNLSAISLSLDMDSAFDTIDSMLGAGTTTKAGTALYGAALPVCREMAMEVCGDDALSIAENGYMMAIEQDCNTVSKTYETLKTQAMEKVREGSALLDMSRLDIHQKRNSDDILTCKKKMLDMLADSAVCGTDLGKCLDTTGKYIDPSTGEAFLTVNLVDLDALITRPSGNQKWSAVPGNEKFISFLNNKKKYLEPAMENCQDIGDSVWNAFMEDALAQIKLAQGHKLEEMRQSCTSLTTQCMQDTAKSISDFDARALSIFGVSADKTVNEMCSSVRTACTALLDKVSGESPSVWTTGMDEIETDKTYETIISTCREVGKACIIQTCKSISGNFGLCESIDMSVNRKSVINAGQMRDACWAEVQNCVASAGIDKIKEINQRHMTSGHTDYYDQMYGEKLSVPAGFDITNASTHNYLNDGKYYEINGLCAGNDPICRLTEKIWGNCDYHTGSTFQKDGTSTTVARSEILPVKPGADDTLLLWFAKGTGTATGSDIYRNCSDTYNLKTDEGVPCSNGLFHITSDFRNCCTTNVFDTYNNCCASGLSIEINNIKLCVPVNSTAGEKVLSYTGTQYYAPTNSTSTASALYCIGTLTGTNPSEDFPSGKTIMCNGKWVFVNPDTGVYYQPNDGGIGYSFYRALNGGSNTECKYTYNGSAWGWSGTNCKIDDAGNTVVIPPYDNKNNLFIRY